MITTEQALKALIVYGQQKGLLNPLDAVVATNALFDAVALTPFNLEEVALDERSNTLTLLLDALAEEAIKQGRCGDSSTEKELFYDRLMGFLTPRHSEVVKTFQEDYKINPERATLNFYRQCEATNYIKTEQIACNISFMSHTPVGNLEITINLSKPEKDPREIAKAKSQPQSGYPKCVLCLENVGFAGSFNQPARQNHRVVPLTLQGEEWFFQFSPYVYYNQHTIVFKKEHEPMSIGSKTFARFFDFLEQFPHYFIGSNADLPIVGGSILNHEHFQAGQHPFAMEKAKTLATYSHSNYKKVQIEVLDWPLSVIRLTSLNRLQLEELASLILKEWRTYSDEEADILAFSGDTPHNTITPIARKVEKKFQLDLVLRNNRTTASHPLGIFHPHQEHHHIKKENIGLIEVLGLAILPGRLINELNGLINYLDKPMVIEEDSPLYKHNDWLTDLRKTYKEGNKLEFLQQQVGQKFLAVLNNCGVFKTTPQGLESFHKVMSRLGCQKLQN